MLLTASSQVLQGASQIHEVFLKEYFPNWNVVYCSNTEEGCRAVADGTADCMLFSNYRITQTERLRKQYKLTVLPAWKGMNFVFATRRNEGELYHILNQTSSLVSPRPSNLRFWRIPGRKNESPWIIEVKDIEK